MSFKEVPGDDLRYRIRGITISLAALMISVSNSMIAGAIHQSLHIIAAPLFEYTGNPRSNNLSRQTGFPNPDWCSTSIHVAARPYGELLQSPFPDPVDICENAGKLVHSRVIDISGFLGLTRSVTMAGIRRMIVTGVTLLLNTSPGSRTVTDNPIRNVRETPWKYNSIPPSPKTAMDQQTRIIFANQ